MNSGNWHVTRGVITREIKLVNEQIVAEVALQLKSQVSREVFDVIKFAINSDSMYSRWICWQASK